MSRAVAVRSVRQFVEMAAEPISGSVPSGKEEEVHRFAMFVCGALTGAILGGAVAILMAPRPGTETRAEIGARLGEVRADAKKAYDQRRKELMADYERATEQNLSR
jgi:hypothetical protein